MSKIGIATDQSQPLRC